MNICKLQNRGENIEGKNCNARNGGNNLYVAY